MDISIGTVGRIISGDDNGKYVKVYSDSGGTGGYFVITASLPSMQDGFDDWIQDIGALERYFQESKWVIDWQE